MILINTQCHRDTQYFSLVEDGVALFDNEQYDLALASFWKAFRIRPFAPVVLVNIAKTMEQLNDANCENFYAAAATQGNVDAHYQLAVLYIANGRTEAAVASLRAYLNGNPANDSCTEWARNTIQKLCPSPVLAWSKGKRVYAD